MGGLMASKSNGMTERDLSVLVDSEIQDAIAYDDTELSKERTVALDYERGEMSNDTPAPPGRSGVVSFDVRDAIEWVMPDLLDMFLATDEVVRYEPTRPGDEPVARQATDYVNYLFLRECRGFQVLHDAIHDALLVRNGYVKFWWDGSPEYEYETLAGLTDDQLALLEQTEDLTIVGHTAEETMIDGQPVTLHDVRIEKLCRRGRLCVMAVPPEEMLINDGATDWENVRFVAHRRRATRSDLIKEGYDASEVGDIPTYTSDEIQDERAARRESQVDMRHGGSTVDRSMEEVEVFECYLQCDYDGDGVAEWRQVVKAGPAGSRKLLRNEEWEDEVPFADLRTGRVPHRWQGRSIFDLLRDIQRIKTVLWRQALDNLYLQNFPRTQGPLSQIKNPDEIINPTLGGHVDTDTPGAIQPLAIPFVADKVFPVLDVLDGVAQKRAGSYEMAADPEALQNQSATANNNLVASAARKTKMIGRLLAEGGMDRLFRCLLKLIVKHQDVARVIRLRDEWVTMDPRTWNANMDCTVNTGLGTGSRERDLMMLNNILQIQQVAFEKLGPGNPFVGLSKIANTAREMVKAAGLKLPDMFFGEVSPEDEQAMAEASGKNPELEAKQMEAQAKIQLEQMKAQMQMDLQREKLSAEIQLQREKLNAEIQLKREQMIMEREMGRENAIIGAQTKMATTPVRLGGEIG